MLMKQTALENNLAVMSKYAADHGFVLAPHGKTTMAPKVFQRQLDAGAWAITVANMSQAAVAYEAGAQRVLVANEIVSLADALAIVESLVPKPSPAARAGTLLPGRLRGGSTAAPAQPGSSRRFRPHRRFRRAWGAWRPNGRP